MIKIKMVPGPEQVKEGESGIITIIRKYAEHFPDFDMSLVDKDSDDFDVYASHAGVGTHQFPATVPSVSHCHGLYWTGMYQASKWEWAANADVINSMRHAHVITVPSTWVGETIQRDMHRNPIVVPHAVDWDEWQHHEQKGGYVIGYAKNRTGQDVCNPDYLNPLAQAFPKINFMATFAPENPGSNIKTTGVLPYPLMMKAVKKADVFVSCVRETFGIAILEAMAAGLPILGWREGGIVDLVQHGINGYLAQPYDYNDLFQGMDYCLQHRHTLGSNGREMARKWTWENVCRQLYEVYSTTIEKAQEAPTCAVIIPSYKYADRVGGAINSALKQTYSRLTDVVVVDDCSPDDGATERIVKEYIARDKRVHYVRLPHNSGVATARNAGILNTDTKYICCLDADDFIAPQFLEVCISPLEQDRSLGISFTSLEAVTTDDKRYETRWPPDVPDFNQQIAGKNQVPTCCVFRREIWDNLGGYRSRYAPEGCGSEDADLWTRIGANGWGAVKASTARLFIYNLGGNTTGRKGYKEPDWRAWHPWARDKIHPVASLATPSRGSHAARIYDTPSISVIIPVGPGHELDVVDAMDSLEAQNFRFWEAVVVGDGVDLGKFSLAMKPFPYARIFYTEDGPKGAGIARNLGAKNARAGLLVFLDADDYLLPGALSTMIDDFGKGEAIVYGDCQGEAIVEDINKLSAEMRHNIIERNARTNRTLIHFPASEYDCELAQKQPTSDDPNQLYLVAHITCLLPKAWHLAIGGFDETMPTWEDVDWHWRLSRAGYCYRHIHQELFVYRLSLGNRREVGRNHFREIIPYLTKKYKEIQTMPCKTCGGSSTPPTVKQPIMQQQPSAQQRFADEDYVEVEYMHPNHGQHSVIGTATHTNYGYRAGGDKFLVHVNDIAAQPMYFRRLQLDNIAVPREEVQPPPPPPSIVRPPESVPEPEEKSESLPVDLLATATEVIAPPLDENVELDVDTIPGITPAIAQQMRDASLVTPRSILDSGLAGLQELRGVGPARASAIIEYIAKKVGL